MSSADECGWRRYPAAESIIRIPETDPERYQIADQVERYVELRLGNYFAPQLKTA
jgi:hypothetical protein